MRFVQPVVLLLGIATYVGVFVLLANTSGPGALVWVAVIVGAWNLIMLVATVMAVVNTIHRIRTRMTRQLATDSMIVKLASIPFFLVNFGVLVFVANASIVLIYVGPILWTVLSIGITLTYLTMLSTSIPVWATIVQLRRERIIDTGLTVLYATVSLLFVTDVAAGILLFGHSRRRPRFACMWLLLGTGGAMIVVGILELLFGFLISDFPELDYGGVYLDWLLWFIPLVAGTALILATAIVSAAQRSTLRLEAQTALPIETPIRSGTFGTILAG